MVGKVQEDEVAWTVENTTENLVLFEQQRAAGAQACSRRMNHHDVLHQFLPLERNPIVLLIFLQNGTAVR
jgi:hypothetical protein